MPRFEVRFYDALNRVKVTVELDGPDAWGVELAALCYLRSDLVSRLTSHGLVPGVVRELR